MIVVDTSALIAILNKEPDAATYAEAIADEDQPVISAASLVELDIVMFNRHGARAAQMVRRLIHEGGFHVESFTVQHAELAREAYAQYGKGHHAAGLNYGDCFSYALAKASGAPLLFKGQDFARTDILAALAKT